MDRQLTKPKPVPLCAMKQVMVKVYPHLILLFLSILGCPAHAADPERFFRLCGLICTALRASLGACVLMMLSFLKYNKEFMPSDSEVAVEYYRRRDLKRQERRAAGLEKKRKEREVRVVCVLETFVPICLILVFPGTG